MKKADQSYRSKSVKDLTGEVKKLRTELAKLSLERTTSGQKDINVISKKKQSLAVILTLINEKQQEEQVKAEVKKTK